MYRPSTGPPGDSGGGGKWGRRPEGQEDSMSCWAGVRLAGAALALAVALCVPAMAQDAGQCSAPLEARGLEHAPVHFRERIAQGKPLKIVAIGSSSTSGAGASSRNATYPARLEAELKAQLPGLPITVLNKGIGGEEAPQ